MLNFDLKLDNHSMISVAEARNLINSQAPDWGVKRIPVTQSVGSVLAEDIYADRDFPPFDRVTMDGIAISFDAFDGGQRRFVVSGVQLAGQPAVLQINKEQALEIMTGAVLPEGYDLVIRYEDLQFEESGDQKWVSVLSDDAFRWKNIHRQGSDDKQGARLIEHGKVINSNIVSILATVGVSEVLVKKLPKVAVISTGDELVDVTAKPAPHQIRKSNVIAIEAELYNRRITFQSFHLNDDKKILKASIAEILEDFDVLLLSGGVSMGKADYLPDVLTELGVNKLFHKVAQRPGKPFWFGVSGNEKPVFAFPGNPISTLMCFRIYFLEWLDRCLGIAEKEVNAELQEDFTFTPQLGYFLQVRSEFASSGIIQVYPEMGNGSGDLSNLSKSDAFIYLPAAQTEFKAGEKFRYYPFI